jgi:hypothetical protein
VKAKMSELFLKSRLTKKSEQRELIRTGQKLGESIKMRIKTDSIDFNIKNNNASIKSLLIKIMCVTEAIFKLEQKSSKAIFENKEKLES